MEIPYAQLPKGQSHVDFLHIFPALAQRSPSAAYLSRVVYLMPLGQTLI
jgi:hypothetical protein